MSAIYDNWERLVAAALKKQQLWELFHAHSGSPSILSEASDFSSSFSSSPESSSKPQKYISEPRESASMGIRVEKESPKDGEQYRSKSKLLLKALINPRKSKKHEMLYTYMDES